MAHPVKPLGFFVHVDRSFLPPLPEGMIKLEDPEFERSGLADYNLMEIDSWLHDLQKTRYGVVQGNVIYAYLKSIKALGSCPNLQDGFAIQQKGPLVFRNLFWMKTLPLWAAVMSDEEGVLFVPGLRLNESSDDVVLVVYPLDSWFNKYHPTLRFCSKNK